MSGIEMLMKEFDEKTNLSVEVEQKFIDVALVLKDLPSPLNVQAVRKLLDIRRLVIRGS